MTPREPYNWPAGPSQAIRDIEADFAQLRARYSYLPRPSKQEQEYAVELAARVAALEARKTRRKYPRFYGDPSC